jgi:hypothetical protein
MKKVILGMVVAGLIGSCATTKKDTVTGISSYSGAAQPAGQSALVYGLPQTRLYFEVEMVKTVVKKGPYSEYASRMLGLQNVPTADSESWQIKSIRVNDKQEVDNKHLYAVSFTDYPQNLDKLLRFTKDGLILDLTVGNVLVFNQTHGKISDDLLFVNAAVRNTITIKEDTVYKTILTETAFERIPVLQRKVMSKTIEEQARDAADQIFEIRKNRLDILYCKIDIPEGPALKLILQALDAQEEQLLSLFNGVKIESRQIVTYSALPEKSATDADLFYFSERTGIVNKNTTGAKAVWYQIGKATPSVPSSPTPQASNLIYYRIPQVVEVSAGVDKTPLVSEQITICQFGNIVSFPLVAPPKKR